MKRYFLLLLMAITINLNLLSANVFETTVGKFKVFLLSEGQQQANASILLDATPEMIQKTATNGSFPNAVNAFLLQTGDKNILIDTGFGRNLFANLQECGVDASQIDIVLITHAHGDHIGGLLKNGQVAFPNATVYFSEPEYNYWLSSGNANFKNIVDAYADKLKTFANNQIGKITNKLFDGIIPIAAYGHTPGHTAFLIESDNHKLLVWGDLAHAMAIQIPYPQVAVTYDVNPAEAVKSRLNILKYVTTEEIPIAGMHIAFPGMGKITKTDKGFEYYPF
ncbi:MAG: MBL fold metallo-hydrolase [Paludibacter sp.]|nr:MBL fold metallo-hydrolase [Paludibacter sp.]